MQFMMRLAPITFPIAVLAGLGWCIGIALLEQPHGIGYALTRHCLMTLVAQQTQSCRPKKHPSLLA